MAVHRHRDDREAHGVGCEVADQGRHPLGLPGRVRSVLRRRRRRRDPGLRRADGSQGREQERPDQGHEGRPDRRSSDQARRHRLLERLDRPRHQGDQAPDGEARSGRHDRPALGRRVDRGREVRQDAPEEDVRERHGRRSRHDDARARAELLPLERRRRAVERRHRLGRLQGARLAQGRRDHGRLLVRLDVGSRASSPSSARLAGRSPSACSRR